MAAMEAIKPSRSITTSQPQTNVNLPNLLTLSRILLIPVFVVLFSDPSPERSLWAASVFVVAAVTDVLDGYVARRRSQITKLGRLLDPIADKLLVLSGLFLLVELGQVPAWVAIVITGREVAVTGIRAIAASAGIVIAAERLGKYKMVFQVIAITSLIVANAALPGLDFAFPLGMALLYVALVLGVVSGAMYLLSFWQQVAAKGL
jgi:CDP-diacylglycerol--glycerol-3-phosphate 3-phosphatidyltransferase